MKIESCEFIKSVYRIEELPKRRLPEVAFFGRSNVGKSSLINCLTGKKIAKISRTPGKTQCLNYFLINNQFYIVDAPGYGYAKVPDKLRKKWDNLMSRWIELAEFQRKIIFISDASIPIQESDLLFYQWLKQFNLPFVLVLNKIDRINRSEIQKTVDSFASAFHCNTQNIIIPFSAKTKFGRNDLLKVINNFLSSGSNK